MCPGLPLSVATCSGPPVTVVNRYWLVAKVAESPTAQELRSMSGVVKKARLRCQAWCWSFARQVRWPSVEEKNDEGGFPWLGEITNKKRWVKEWNDSVACGTIDSELHAVARHVVGAMHQKYGGSNSS